MMVMMMTASICIFNNFPFAPCRFYQKTTHLLIRRAPFGRLCREILLEKHPQAVQFRWHRQALECIQEAAEAFLVAFLSDANLAAIHAKRVTLMIKDMLLIRTLKQL